MTDDEYCDLYTIYYHKAVRKLSDLSLEQLKFIANIESSDDQLFNERQVVGNLTAITHEVKANGRGIFSTCLGFAKHWWRQNKIKDLKVKNL